jgi:hypothetical protein
MYHKRAPAREGTSLTATSTLTTTSTLTAPISRVDPNGVRVRTAGP